MSTESTEETESTTYFLDTLGFSKKSSPGSLITMSRSRHSEGDMAVATAVTVEAYTRLLEGGLEVEEGPKESI